MISIFRVFTLNNPTNELYKNTKHWHNGVYVRAFPTNRHAPVGVAVPKAGVRHVDTTTRSLNGCALNHVLVRFFKLTHFLQNAFHYTIIPLLLLFSIPLFVTENEFQRFVNDDVHFVWNKLKLISRALDLKIKKKM